MATRRVTPRPWVGYPDKLADADRVHRRARCPAARTWRTSGTTSRPSVYAIDAERENARRQKQIEKLQREGKEIPPELQETVPTTTDPAFVPTAPSTTPVTPPSNDVDTRPGTEDGTVEEQQQATPGGATDATGTPGGGGDGTTGQQTPTPATPPPATPDAGAPATGGAAPEAGGAAAPPG